MPWAAAATIGGAIISSNAAGDAADTQAASTAGGHREQRQYDQTRADQEPYRRQIGSRSLGGSGGENYTPLDPNSVQMDPGYEFARQQGQQAIDRKTAAAGGRISGASP
jgi:hypothetical protein